MPKLLESSYMWLSLCKNKASENWSRCFFFIRRVPTHNFHDWDNRAQTMEDNIHDPVEILSMFKLELVFQKMREAN